MGIVLFFKKRVAKAQMERQEFCKKALLVFYSRKYEREAKEANIGVDIPYFYKAEQQVENLEKRGLIIESYRQLREMGCL